MNNRTNSKWASTGVIMTIHRGKDGKFHVTLSGQHYSVTVLFDELYDFLLCSTQEELSE